MTGRIPDFNAAWPKEVLEVAERGVDLAAAPRPWVPPPKPTAPPSTKTIWITVGAAWIIGDPREGKIKLRIDSIPIGWDGSLVLFPTKKQQEPPP